MSYPFPTFPLVNRIGITTPVANIDARYGPWATLNEALTSFNSGLRFRGLTVAVLSGTGVIEYWFRDGVADNNLILKNTGSGGGVLPGNVILDGGNSTGANLTAGTNDNFNLILETNSLPRVTITNTGNVGINTNIPNESLTVFGNISATGLINAANIDLQVLQLTNNLPQNTFNVISGTSSGVITQTVSADQRYLIDSFLEGMTITLFVSGNHETLKRHNIVVSGAVTRINGVGQSNQFYTFKNHITKTTLTRQSIDRVTGTAEIIRTDLNTSQGGLGYLSLEQGATVEQILQEDGDRLVIRNFV
jgi:hypothetical protein